MRKACYCMVLFLLSIYACANPLSDHLRQKTSDAQVRYQSELCKLLISRAPDLKEIWDLSRDLQISLIHKRDMQYEYLWKNHPNQINTKGNYLNWLNFEWTDEDDKTLTNESSNYAQLVKQITELMKKNQDHPMWPKAHEKFAELKNDSSMKTIEDDLNKVFKEVDSGLKSR